jgi:hypothetical protein
MLAGAPRGIREEALMLVHGFSIEMLASLVQAGFATVATEARTMRPGVTIEIERIRIMDAGKRALEG